MPRDNGHDMVLNVGGCTTAVPLHTTNMVIGLLWANPSHVGKSILVHDLGTNGVSNQTVKLPCGSTDGSGILFFAIHHATEAVKAIDWQDTSKLKGTPGSS